MTWFSPEPNLEFIHAWKTLVLFLEHGLYKVYPGSFHANVPQLNAINFKVGCDLYPCTEKFKIAIDW